MNVLPLLLVVPAHVDDGSGPRDGLHMSGGSTPQQDADGFASGSGSNGYASILNGAQVQGYVIATYTLEGLLTLLPPGLTRGQSVALTELDGTRLAVLGAPRRGTRVFVAQQVLDLPGAPMPKAMSASLASAMMKSFAPEGSAWIAASF